MADQRPCKLSFESSPLAESTHRSCAVWASRKGRDIGPPAPNDNAHGQTSFLETSCKETMCQTKTRCTPPSPPSSRAACSLSCVVSPSSRVWAPEDCGVLPLPFVAVMPTILASKSPPKRGEGQGGDNKAEEMSASACARACACACASHLHTCACACTVITGANSTGTKRIHTHNIQKHTNNDKHKQTNKPAVRLC